MGLIPVNQILFNIKKNPCYAVNVVVTIFKILFESL